MTTLFSALDWRVMSQEERDLGLNNSVAVKGSAEMVAGWEQRSAELRKRYPAHIDLRYGPRERNRIDFLKAADRAPTLLFIHGGDWQARAKEVFTVVAEGPMAHGINVALIGYTLAPEATLDEIVAEIRAGIDYLAKQLPMLGGAERWQLPGEENDAGVNFGNDLVERRLRRQRVADQRHIDAMRHRPFGNDGKNLLGTGLPIAAVDEQQRRRVVSGFEEIDPVALAWAVAQVDMSWETLPHLGGALLPAGDHLRAAGHGNAVVETEIPRLPAHGAPVQRGKQCRHADISGRPPLGDVSTLPENVLQHHQRPKKKRKQEIPNWRIRTWCVRRRAPLSAS